MSLRLPTEEQESLSRGMSDFLAGNFPLERFRNGDTADSARWPDLAEMGVMGISLPEADGGMALSWVDEVLACREAGRYLISPALIGSILAARVAARADLSSVCEALLAGNCRAGIAMRHSAAELRVIDGESGLCLMVEPQRVRLLDFGNSQLQPIDCIDETVTLATAQDSASELASVEDAKWVLGAQLMAAAMLCGVLETTRDMAADYARTRVQFGRPIGAFQAIKHRCADVAMAAELCWSQTLHAAGALMAGASDVEFHVLTAKLLSGDEALKAARFNIQAHGGMGFTDEVDAHRLLKRAHVLTQLFDDPRRIRAKLVNLNLEI